MGMSKLDLSSVLKPVLTQEGEVGFLTRLLFRWCVTFLLSMTWARVSSANAYVEPYFGYISGTHETDYIRDGIIRFNTNGLSYGARLGYSYSDLFVAFDYMGFQQWWAMLEDSSAGFNSGSIANSSGSVMGVMLGAKYKSLTFRFIYGFQYQETVNVSPYGTQVLKSTRSYRAGVDYSGFQSVVINFDYMTTNFSEYSDELGGNGIGPGGSRSSLLSSAYILGLSVPFGGVEKGQATYHGPREIPR